MRWGPNLAEFIKAPSISVTPSWCEVQFFLVLNRKPRGVLFTRLKTMVRNLFNSNSGFSVLCALNGITNLMNLTNLTNLMNLMNLANLMNLVNLLNHESIRSNESNESTESLAKERNGIS